MVGVKVGKLSSAKEMAKACRKMSEKFGDALRFLADAWKAGLRLSLGKREAEKQRGLCLIAVRARNRHVIAR